MIPQISAEERAARHAAYYAGKCIICRDKRHGAGWLRCSTCQRAYRLGEGP
ncbi:hypothetical protein [Mycobacterium phage Weirdo19]|uniref:Uncharacterized protein n=1 Tax=Mycobacterium phage Weirdo19 TaxID=2601610 RepID=A0A6M2YTG4_9CAUD|nr:hypothetical protein KDJ11_gp81 [Mycobacterium phage Weirdo19]QEA10849.1 hypothetical protein [Mycobacterium phage Weirdo19]